MKRQKDDKRIVVRSLAMVTQFGLNMLVPVCMMSVLGVWLDRKLDTVCFTIILFAAGAAAGGQNIYRLAQRICGIENPEKIGGGSPEEAGGGKSSRAEAGKPEGGCGKKAGQSDCGSAGQREER